MKTDIDPFQELVVEAANDEFVVLSNRPVTLADARSAAPSGAVTARFHGFDLDDRPLLVGLPGLRGEIVPARTTTPLRRAQIGAMVVVLCENGNVRLPIVVGVLQERPILHEGEMDRAPAQSVSIRADDDQLTLSAERQIELRCGAASITLTRAGKIVIQGSYVLSRSTGYNKIKGAAVDIN